MECSELLISDMFLSMWSRSSSLTQPLTIQLETSLHQLLKNVASILKCIAHHFTHELYPKNLTSDSMLLRKKLPSTNSNYSWGCSLSVRLHSATSQYVVRSPVVHMILIWVNFREYPFSCCQGLKGLWPTYSWHFIIHTWYN